MSETKAEQLADRLVQTSSLGTILICDSAATELRRLSPMEAERDKLLKVNKVLVDALKLGKHWFPALNQSDVSPTTWLTYLQDSASMDKALKLAGEIK